MTGDIVINHIIIKGNEISPIIDICAICRENAGGKCSKCINTTNTCFSVMGKCSHIYHLCCINGWHISNRKVCPTCSNHWDIKLRNK